MCMTSFITYVNDLERLFTYTFKYGLGIILYLTMVVGSFKGHGGRSVKRGRGWGTQIC